MVAVTSISVDACASANVIFWMSARPGDTDTTAKLARAAAKWLVPGLISCTEVAWRVGLAGCGSVGLLVQTGARVTRKGGSDARLDRVNLNGPLLKRLIGRERRVDAGVWIG